MEKLIQKLAELDGKIQAIADLENPTAEDGKAFDALMAERANVDAQIKRQETVNANKAQREVLEQRERERQVNEERARRASGTRITTPDAPNHTTARVDDKGREVSFFEETDEAVELRFGNTADAVRRQSYQQQRKANRQSLKTAGYTPWGGFKSAADFIRSGLENHTNSSFREQHRGHFAAVNGMSEGVGSDGGYMVMPELSNRIIDRVYGNDLWGRTDNYSVSGNSITFLANAETSRATGSRHGGLRGYWLSEGGSITSSKPTLREISLKLAKLGVVVYLTNELVADGGAALESYVTRKAIEEFNFMLGDSLFNGTGVGQPLGLLNWPSLLSISAESGQTASTIVTENVEKMYARFYMPNMSNAIWFNNQDTMPQLQRMTLDVGTGGVPTYMPPGGVSAAPYGSLKGRPVQPTEFNATLGTVGDLVLADLGQMLSISKGGVMQAVSMHIQFLTDQLALRFILRVNAGPWESAPITPYKGTANTQSSAIALATRS